MAYLRSLRAIGCKLAAVAMVTGVFSVTSIGARAHEFWLEPSSFAPEAGAAFTITHRNGQNFKGSTYPYLRQWFDRFQVHEGGAAIDVAGVDGDDPAATLTLKTPGTVIVSYVSKPDSLTFATWEKFTSYLKTEGIEQVADRHRARGLPETGFTEKYVRNAKTLINVGGTATQDRVVGLDFELIVETPLVQLADGKEIRVKLLHRGKPHPNQTIKVFRKSDGENPARVVTDADGRASLKVVGGETYLLNAVVMELPKAGIDAAWFSLWASTTFNVPE